MLVLSRRVNEKIVFPTLGVSVQVVGVKGGLVRLGIAAPPEVHVLRGEVKDRRVAAPGQASGSRPDEAAERGLDRLGDLVRRRLEINRRGLDLLASQIAAGQLAAAGLTLASIEEDLRLLQSRVDPDRPAAGDLRSRPIRRALLVEDDPNERDLMARFLRKAGLDVATASDGADALDYLNRRGHPDVVLLDMGLPRTGGAEVVRTVRRDPSYAGLKIFAVTGHTQDEFDLAQGPGGVDRWYHKPVDPEDLVRGMTQELDSADRYRP